MSLIKESENLRIPFEDIKEATKNFTTLIGRGGYGPVYRGQLSLSGVLTVVAVKRLQTDYGQGIKEFLTEIQLLSRYKHQNLVSLVGFCEERNEKFLIYEFAEHGSLDSYLKPKKTTCPLSWKQRIQICVDASRGLDHLHNHVAQHERVIHRDIKSANILLHHNRKAMIADFGLSKLGRANENDTYLITNASGTYGYCDPAYIRTGILTKESDVYSFGVVLFEVLCGRLCFINVNSDERFLAPLAQRYYEEGKLNLIIDRDLKNYMNSDSMKVFMEIAFQCLQDAREHRPSMGLVLQELTKALKLLEIEEAPELLELEQALELNKLVETMKMQQFEELRIHIGESQVDYEVIKAIYYMLDTPLSDIERERVYSHLSHGILVDEGKVWLSIDDDGKTQEMISSIKVLPEVENYTILSDPESRFSKIADLCLEETTQVKIRTQFLSSDVTYAAYLVCKPFYVNSSLENFAQHELRYTVKDKDYGSYPSKMEDREWLMFELFQTTSFNRTADFEVTFRGLAPLLLFEGIQFLPIQKWFWITRSNGKKCFILPPTSLSHQNDLSEIMRIPSETSRVETVLLRLPPIYGVGMRFEVPHGLLSTNTTYGCYLVYKAPQDRFPCETIIMKLYDGDHKFMYLRIPQRPVIGPDGLLGSPNPMNKLKTIQLPKKRKDGWLEVNLGSRSDIQWMNMEQDARFGHCWRRERTWKSFFLPCISYNESGNGAYDVSHNGFTLDPSRFSIITIYMWRSLDYQNPRASYDTQELIVQGIEFRPV